MGTSRYIALTLGLMFLLLAILVGWGGSSALSPLALLPPIVIPSPLVWITGLVAGGFLTFGIIGASVDLRAWPIYLALTFLIIVLSGFAVLVILAATTGPSPMPPIRAGLVFLLGTLGVAATLRTLLLLHAGRPIQFDTNWGGLGGGMGGWRISPTAAFAALTIILLSATLTVGLVLPPQSKGDTPPNANGVALSNGVESSRDSTALPTANTAAVATDANVVAAAANTAATNAARSNSQ
jgi:hypothetical protein